MMMINDIDLGEKPALRPEMKIPLPEVGAQTCLVLNDHFSPQYYDYLYVLSEEIANEQGGDGASCCSFSRECGLTWFRGLWFGMALVTGVIYSFSGAKDAYSGDDDTTALRNFWCYTIFNIILSFYFTDSSFRDICRFDHLKNERAREARERNVNRWITNRFVRLSVHVVAMSLALGVAAYGSFPFAAIFKMDLPRKHPFHGVFESFIHTFGKDHAENIIFWGIFIASTFMNFKVAIDVCGEVAGKLYPLARHNKYVHDFEYRHWPYHEARREKALLLAEIKKGQLAAIAEAKAILKDLIQRGNDVELNQVYRLLQEAKQASTVELRIQKLIDLQYAIFTITKADANWIEPNKNQRRFKNFMTYGVVYTGMFALFNYGLSGYMLATLELLSYVRGLFSYAFLGYIAGKIVGNARANSLILQPIPNFVRSVNTNVLQPSGERPNNLVATIFHDTVKLPLTVAQSWRSLVAFVSPYASYLNHMWLNLFILGLAYWYGQYGGVVAYAELMDEHQIGKHGVTVPGSAQTKLAVSMILSLLFNVFPFDQVLDALMQRILLSPRLGYDVNNPSLTASQTELIQFIDRWFAHVDKWIDKERVAQMHGDIVCSDLDFVESDTGESVVLGDEQTFELRSKLQFSMWGKTRAVSHVKEMPDTLQASLQDHDTSNIRFFSEVKQYLAADPSRALFSNP